MNTCQGYVVIEHNVLEMCEIFKVLRKGQIRNFYLTLASSL